MARFDLPEHPRTPRVVTGQNVLSGNQYVFLRTDDDIVAILTPTQARDLAGQLYAGAERSDQRMHLRHALLAAGYDSMQTDLIMGHVNEQGDPNDPESD